MVGGVSTSTLSSQMTKILYRISFGVGAIFWGKKNWDQIDNDVTMTSSLL